MGIFCCRHHSEVESEHQEPSPEGLRGDSPPLRKSVPPAPRGDQEQEQEQEQDERKHIQYPTTTTLDIRFEHQLRSLAVSTGRVVPSHFPSQALNVSLCDQPASVDTASMPQDDVATVFNSLVPLWGSITTAERSLHISVLSAEEDVLPTRHNPLAPPHLPREVMVFPTSTSGTISNGSILSAESGGLPPLVEVLAGDDSWSAP